MFNVVLAVLAATPLWSVEPDKQSDCPASQSIPETLINPVGLKSWLKGHPEVKTETDIICCLPESYRSKIYVAPSSLAGQPGSPHSPRVLLTKIDTKVSPDPYAHPLNAIFSLNGGARRLNNGDHVEMMYNDVSLGEVEYFDIEPFAGAMKIGGKNPQSCMGCHGHEGAVSVGGAHPIFEPLTSWTRFMNGFLPCPEEQDYIAAIDQAAKASLEANPHFKCIRPSERHQIATAQDLAMLEQHLLETNARRTAKVIKSLPDYQKYKFVLMGAALCSGESESGFDVTKWIPAPDLKQHDNALSLDPRIAHSTDLKGTYRAIFQELKGKYDRIAREHVLRASQVREGKDPHFEIYTGRFFNQYCSFEDPTAAETSDFADLSGPPLLDKYKIDSRLSTFRAGAGSDPIFRYLTAGRGIDTRDLQMSHLDSYSFNGSFLEAAFYLVDQEPYDSPIRKYIKVRSASWRSRHHLEVVDDGCIKLRSLSWRAFSGTPPQTEKGQSTPLIQPNSAAP